MELYPGLCAEEECQCLGCRLTDATNRGKRQTLELYNLLNKDFDLYLELEEKIKNNHLHYCPGDKPEADKVLAMGYGSNWFSLNAFRPLTLEEADGHLCKHKRTGALGTIWYKLEESKDFPTQWGAHWHRGQPINHGSYGNVYVWNNEHEIAIRL